MVTRTWRGWWIIIKRLQLLNLCATFVVWAPFLVIDHACDKTITFIPYVRAAGCMREMRYMTGYLFIVLEWPGYVIVEANKKMLWSLFSTWTMYALRSACTWFHRNGFVWTRNTFSRFELWSKHVVDEYVRCLRFWVQEYHQNIVGLYNLTWNSFTFNIVNWFV